MKDDIGRKSGVCLLGLWINSLDALTWPSLKRGERLLCYSLVRAEVNND